MGLLLGEFCGFIVILHRGGAGGIIQTYVCPMGFLCDSFPCTNRDRQKAAWFGRCPGPQLSRERAPGRERGQPSLPPANALKHLKGVSQTPPGDPSDPAATKAIFLVIAPEPRTYPEKGSSGGQRRALALLSSLWLGQKLSGHSAPRGRNPPVPNSGL